MHQPTMIQYSVLIGIIGRARLQKLDDKRSLTAEATTWNNDRLALPADHPGMNEDPARRIIGNMELHHRFKIVQESRHIIHLHNLAVIFKEFVQAHSPPIDALTQNDGVEFINRGFGWFQ